MAQFTKENLLSELEARMKKTEEALKNGFAAIRTGKASPALVIRRPLAFLQRKS